MLEKTLNRIMHGPNTLEGKIIAVFMAVVLSLMTWNATTITYAFADDKVASDTAASSQSEKKTETTEKKSESTDVKTESQAGQTTKDTESKAEPKSGEQAEKSSEAQSKGSESKSSEATTEGSPSEEQAKKTSESDAKASDNAGAEGDAAKDKDSQNGTEASAGKESDNKSAEPEAVKDATGNGVAGAESSDADSAKAAPKIETKSTKTVMAKAAAKKIAVTVNLHYRTASGWTVKAIKSTLSSGGSVSINAATYSKNASATDAVYEFTGWNKEVPSSIGYDEAAQVAGEGTTATFEYTAEYKEHKHVKVNYEFKGVRQTDGTMTSSNSSTTLKWSGSSSSATIKAPKNPAANSTVRVAADEATYVFKGWQDETTGAAANLPMTITYDEVFSKATDGEVSYQFVAQYDEHKDITVTVVVKDILTSGQGASDRQIKSQKLSWGDGTSISKKNFESTTGVVAGNSQHSKFSFLGIKYEYTGKWIPKNGASEAVSGMVNSSQTVSLVYKDLEDSGTKRYLTEDTEFVFSPDYTQTIIQGLDYYYIDNVSTGSGSWSNKGAAYRSDFSALTHTFKNPEETSPTLTPHYKFVQWQDFENNKTYKAGASFKYSVDSGLPEGTVTTFHIYAVWQPSITVNYYSWDGKLLETVEEFEKGISTEAGYPAPKIDGADFLGWYMGTDKDAEKAADSYALPATTTEKVKRAEYNVYARYSTSYTVEHAQQNIEDDEYSVVESETESHGNVLLGTDVTADPKDFTGFTFNEKAEGTLIEQIINQAGIVLKLFYDRNSYDVMYSYTGFVPEDATELPADATYKYGANVNVAAAATATGYTFSGWSRQGSFDMPAENVNIVGSWSPSTGTAYTVRHWLQNVVGAGYSVDQSVAADETRTGTTGQMTQAAARQLAGFTAQAFDQAEIAPDGSTVVNIYYDRNVYTVSYAYAGTAPAGASALPAQASYRYGADVSVAGAATAAGYTFNGWDRQGTFTMPAENVTITGGFTQVPANDDAGNTPPAPTPTTPDAADDAGDPAGPAAPAAPAAAAPAPAAPIVPAVAGAFGATRGALADNPATAIPDDANPLAETIEDDGNPLANLGAWSLFDLLCTILTAILAIVMLVRGIGRKRHGEDDEDAEAEGAPVRTMNAEGDEEEDPESTVYKRRRALRVASIVPAIGAIVLFILTQDLTQPMVWFDMWSLAFAIIAIVNIALLIASRRRKADDDSQDDEQQPAGYAPSAA